MNCIFIIYSGVHITHANKAKILYTVRNIHFIRKHVMIFDVQRFLNYSACSTMFIKKKKKQCWMELEDGKVKG
jgi:ribosomal protein S2